MARRFSVLTPLFLVIPVLPLCAQPQASVHGKVLDPTSARIAGAQVSAVPDGRASLKVTAVSDANGEFNLSLSSGKYTVQISKDNFVAASRSVEVSSAGMELPDTVLQVAPVGSAVTVSEGAGYIVTSSSSATKTSTPLLDVPQSITVVTQDQMKDQMMTSIGDVVRYVPGVTSIQGENNRDQLVIRGNSTSADFFLNGVRDDVQYYRDLYNLDRVEALKGPNAMIFGRGGAGRRDQSCDQGGGCGAGPRVQFSGRFVFRQARHCGSGPAAERQGRGSDRTGCTRTRTHSVITWAGTLRCEPDADLHAG